MKVFLITILIPVLGSIPMAPLGAAPANDNFANRTLISGNSVDVTASLVGATAEIGEPVHWWRHDGSSAHSVWWTWTASNDWRVNVSTTESTFPARLAVYYGTSLSALRPVVTDSGANVTFVAKAGTAYQILVDDSPDHPGDAGEIHLSLRTQA